MGEFHQAFRPILGKSAQAATASGCENDGAHDSGFEKPRKPEVDGGTLLDGNGLHDIA
jgi:hypothetical protein